MPSEHLHKLCELPKDLDDLIFDYGLAMDDRGYSRGVKDANKASLFASSAERYRLRLRRAIRAEIDKAKESANGG